MKAASRSEHPHNMAVEIRRSDNSLLVVDVPDSGADVDAVERALIAFALERTDGNRTRAARFLGLSRSALIYRMHKHGLAGEADDHGPDRPEDKSHQ